MARPEMFAIHLRVPAWADTKTRISVNGKRAEGDPVAGKFFELSRTWKNGDRVDFEIGMPLRLQTVDPENPQIVALLRGPLALFGVGNLPSNFSRAQLLAASTASRTGMDGGDQG